MHNQHLRRSQYNQKQQEFTFNEAAKGRGGSRNDDGRNNVQAHRTQDDAAMETEMNNQSLYSIKIGEQDVVSDQRDMLQFQEKTHPDVLSMR